MIRAGIDIGTNTILLLVAEVQAEKIRVIEDHVRVVRLGQGVDKNRAFLPEAMDRARACFREYAEILRKYPGIDIRAVATSGSRDAKNSVEFFEEIRSLGIPINVISGEEEALLSFRGALPSGERDPESLAVLDIGGGSTEVVGYQNGQIFRHSFNLGCVRLSERFLKSDPATAQEQGALVAFVREELKGQQEIWTRVREKTLVGVAGTATYLASAALGLKKFEVDRVHGFSLTLSKVEELINEFAPQTAAERLGRGGMDKGRADVILAGALLLREIMFSSGQKEIQASVRGLRFGAVL